METDKKGVILLNLGGPDSIEAVKPFLVNLFSDREIIRLGPSPLQKPLAWLIATFRSKKTACNYEMIGGSSPLLEITIEQARALDEKLNKKGFEIKTYIGMRYWHPFILEAVESALKDGVKELVALPLFPHYSRATTGSCFKELERSIKLAEDDIKIHFISNWHLNPFYIKALGIVLKEGFEKFSEESREVHVLFSAHSLPKEFVEKGDPYVIQMNETIQRVVEKNDLTKWSLSFQSRAGPVEWIEPDTRNEIQRLAQQGVKDILMIPISFVSDHIETLYEMDILYKNLGDELGVKIERAPSLNINSTFINALTDIVSEAIINEGEG